jgi:transposase-like protein
MNPHPSRICDSWLENKGRCSECMSPIEEIDFWRECYNGKHNDPADCPTWYDWCNCGGTMFEEIERLHEQNKEMKQELENLRKHLFEGHYCNCEIEESK